MKKNIFFLKAASLLLLTNNFLFAEENFDEENFRNQLSRYDELYNPDKPDLTDE